MYQKRLDAIMKNDQDTRIPLILFFCNFLEELKTEVKKDFTDNIDISISEFVSYQVTRFRLTHEQIVMAFSHILLLVDKCYGSYTEGNKYRIWLVSLMIIHKYTDDCPYSNVAWCKTTPIYTLQKINQMELEFLKAHNYIIKKDKLLYTYNDSYYTIINHIYDYIALNNE